MVIYELLGQKGRPAHQVVPAAATADKTSIVQMHIKDARTVATATPVVQLDRRRNSSSTGSVSSFFRDRVLRVDGERVEMKALMQSYRTWCAHSGISPKDLNGLLDEIEKMCRRVGIAIEPSDDRRVYCLNVKLKATAISAQAVH